jgi:hypothetical protein
LKRSCGNPSAIFTWHNSVIVTDEIFFGCAVGRKKSNWQMESCGWADNPSPEVCRRSSLLQLVCCSVIYVLLAPPPPKKNSRTDLKLSLMHLTLQYLCRYSQGARPQFKPQALLLEISYLSVDFLSDFKSEGATGDPQTADINSEILIYEPKNRKNKYKMNFTLVLTTIDTAIANEEKPFAGSDSVKRSLLVVAEEVCQDKLMRSACLSELVEAI